jgi:aspartyl-tRNA synthetase
MMTSLRTHLVSDLNDLESGTAVRLTGWIAFKRVHKRVAFLGLRDFSGTVQVVCAPERIIDITVESCVRITGTLQPRRHPGDSNMVLTKVEVTNADVEILSAAAPLPFVIEGQDLNSDARLRQRYLDMRRHDLQRSLLLRARLASLLSCALENDGFVQLPTPYLAHRSSGGAREFDVASTVDPIRRYALPQSSQVYRTLIMTGGIERYYQVNRNFRDEWPRADRQFEFSVLDMEAAFVDREDLIRCIEALVAEASRELAGQEIELPFRRINFTTTRQVASQRPAELEFYWIVGHPLFTLRDGRLYTFHQPFDAPSESWTGRLDTSPSDVPSSYFTLVCGKAEVGGGSIRIHRPEVLEQVLTLLGQGHTNSPILEALRYAAPPHGGFTLSLDALAVSLIGGDRNIRSVIPFPKNSAGRCPIFSHA